MLNTPQSFERIGFILVQTRSITKGNIDQIAVSLYDKERPQSSDLFINKSVDRFLGDATAREPYHDTIFSLDSYDDDL